MSKISDGAFYKCSSLATDVYCLAPSAIESKEYVFENSEIGYATLHVPGVALEQYKAADGWKDFGDIVAIQSGDPCYVAPTGVPISFDDPKTEMLCLTYFDANNDFQLSEDEAADVNHDNKINVADIVALMKLL